LGDGILKAKIVKGMYSLRLKFPGGWGMGDGGIEIKKTLHGGMDIFRNNT